MKPQVMPIVFLLLAAFILLNAVAVLADTIQWTWTPQTERTDGTQLTVEEIAGYAFRLNGIEQPALLTGGENNLIIESPLGEQCGEFLTEDTEGRRSVWTDPVCKTALAAPGPISTVTVEIVEPAR